MPDQDAPPSTADYIAQLEKDLRHARRVIELQEKFIRANPRLYGATALEIASLAAQLAAGDFEPRWYVWENGGLNSAEMRPEASYLRAATAAAVALLRAAHEAVEKGVRP